MEFEKTISNIPRKLVIEASGVFLNNLLGDYLVPAGKISHFATTTPPDGWLVCDGSEYDPDIYIDLNNAIRNFCGGTLPTQGPDLSNVFLMYDPSRVKSTSSTTNDETYEDDKIKIHDHTTVNMDNHQHTHNTTIDSHHIHDLNVNRGWVNGLSSTWTNYSTPGLLVGHNQPGRREEISRVPAVWKQAVYNPAAPTRKVTNLAHPSLTLEDEERGHAIIPKGGGPILKDIHLA